MAIITGGILGTTSGKVGPVIASSWRGKNYIRAKGDYRDKKSDLQLIQRNRYAFITEVGTRAYQSIIKPAMVMSVEGLAYSAWNLYCKLNILADDVFNNHYNLQISSGIRKLPSMSYCKINNTSHVFTINWDGSSGQNSSPTDKISIYRLKTDSMILEPISINTIDRSVGTFSVAGANSEDYLNHSFFIFARSSSSVYSSTSGKVCSLYTSG